MNKLQGAYWCLVIHEKAKCFDGIQIILNGLIEINPNIQYSYIYHESDEDCDARHIHLVLYYKGKVTRFTTLQNLFEGAHIEQTNRQRYQRCIQYLVHKNNPEKKQYKQIDVCTNINLEEFAEIMNGNGYEFELFQSEKIQDYFIECYQANNKIDMIYFVNRFGIDAITKYYFVIKDLAKDFEKILRQANYLQQDETTRAFYIKYKDIKQQWQCACMLGYYHNDLETYTNEVYQVFIDEVEKGYIDIKSILKEEEK